MYIYAQEKQNLQQKNEALEMKLRQINLQILEVAKSHPSIAALLNYSTSMSANTTAVSRSSEIGTKAETDDVHVKDVHEPSASEGTSNIIYMIVCTPILNNYLFLTRTQIKVEQYRCQ